MNAPRSRESGQREAPGLLEQEQALPGLGSARSDFSLRAIADGSLGRLPTEMLEAILVHAETDAAQLTDRVFWKVNHPELSGTRLHPTSPAHQRLREEWAAIRRTQVEPIIWLRQLIDQLDRHRGSMEREVLLGWIAVKSDGRVTAIGRSGERGYFQIDWPTASRELRLGPAEFRKLSTDRLFSVRAGVELAVTRGITGDADRAQQLAAKLKRHADLVPASPSSQPEQEEQFESRGQNAKVADPFGVPWRWICKIAIRKSGKYFRGGSGVLISDRHVLTAAHVVYEVYKDRAQFDLEVTPALSGNDSLDTYASSAKPRIPGGYEPGELALDYAVITLDRSIGTKSFSELKNARLCYWGSPECGANTALIPIEPRFLVAKTGYSAGYPKSKGGQTMWQFSGLLHSATAGQGVVWFTGDASEGQSGSPVWIRDGQRYCLSGVLVAEGKASSAVVPLTPDRVAQLRTWMQADTAGELDSDRGHAVDTSAGVSEELNPRSRADQTTPQWIQRALTSSRRLAPFLRAKLAATPVSKNYVHHAFDAEFESVYLRLTKTVVPFGSAQEKALKNIRAFYDRATDSIHLRPAADLGQALRLTLRRFSSDAFRQFFGDAVADGVGLFFANAVLAEQRLEPLAVTAEDAAPLRCAADLVDVAGEAAVATAYFQNHASLVQQLLGRLSIGPATASEITRDQLCRTPLLPSARFAGHRMTNMVSVGMTGPHWVRLWLRSEVAGPHGVQILGGSGGPRGLTVTVQDGPHDKTAAVTYPQTNQHPPLEPLTRYRYRIVRSADQTVVGEGAFETAPARDEDTPPRVVIALWSCHQPFSSQGSIDADSARMLRVVPRILAENGVKFVLPCGDQIYADDPGPMSLFDNPYLIRQVVPGKTSIFTCSADEVRRLYNMRYRTFWSSVPLRKMYAEYPTYPTLDDHEIHGDWGSERQHAGPRFANVMTGALQAYFDYQLKGVLAPTSRLPSSFHYDFSYGNIGVFVMDIRSQRRVDSPSPLFSETQFNDFRQFLRSNGQKKVLLIVTSVPVVHLGRLLTDAGVKIINPALGLFGKDIDFPDHWSYEKNVPARDAFLSLLHAHQEAHPRQRVAILSGDVHIGNAFSVNWQGGNKPRLYQLTSSPLSAAFRGIEADITTLGPRLLSSIDCRATKFGGAASGRVALLPGATRGSRNPLVGFNVGLIEIQRRGDESDLKFKLVGVHPTEDRPVTLFESGWLG